ncbi:MAG: VWFA-related Acidobacterial domain protein [Acidobacteriaceae bacterium]|nr:VWFA-related Acidobacterial domain protein [Acidobacteriaceae bacterium]
MPTIPAFLTILALLLSPLPGCAQGLQDQTRSIAVNVLDSHGSAIRDLTKENFRVRVNGKPAEVLSAEYSLAPRRIVVLLDTSGSMAGNRNNTKWQIAREALTDVIATTPKSVPIALLAFSDRINSTFGFEQGRAAIVDWLRQGPSQRERLKGRTALFDATVAAIKLLQPPQPGDSIYAITDGGDDASTVSVRDTERTMVLSGVRFFIFLLAEPSVTEEQRSGLDSVTQLAIRSGGFIFGARAQRLDMDLAYPNTDVTYDYDEAARENIKLSTQELNIQVNGFYILQLAEPSSRKNGKITLEVLDKPGRSRKDVVVSYPRTLPAAK